MALVRTRFAPSPTGFIHVGSLRTALFAYLFARRNNGTFILRIEDTDRERQVKGAARKILETLEKLGLDPDEGPRNPDPKFGPYIQSERLEIYKEHAERLISMGKAYYCFCTSERLDKLREQQSAEGKPPRYDGHCRDLAAVEVARLLEAGTARVVRFRMPRTGITEYDDAVYGRLQFKNELIDDTILMKTDGYPVYNFANVVDDHLMEITHVIRGEEFLSSTPKHVQLYQAFGWGLPLFAHLPLLLDTNRKKLSKRAGDVAVEDYLKKGYLVPALINFVALLGWNPKSTKEIFSLQELVEEYSLEHVNKSGAIFDSTKLDFINRAWQKRLHLPPSRDPMFIRTGELIRSRTGDADISLLEAVWPQIAERVGGPSRLEEQLPEFDFYFRVPIYEPSLLLWKDMQGSAAKRNLKILRDYLGSQASHPYERADFEEKMKSFISQQDLSMGETLWPLRVALSGQKNSPGPFDIIDVFWGKVKKPQIVIERVDQAIKKLD